MLISELSNYGIDLVRFGPFISLVAVVSEIMGQLVVCRAINLSLRFELVESQKARASPGKGYE